MQQNTPGFLSVKKQPFNVLGLIAVPLFILSLIPSRQVVNITLKDTYVVLTLQTAFAAFAGYLLLMWMLYILFQEIIFSVKLVWAHVIISVFVIFLFFATQLLSAFVDNSSHYTNLQKVHLIKYWYNSYSTAAIMLIAGTMLFLINIAGGTSRRISGNTNFGKS